MSVLGSTLFLPDRNGTKKTESLLTHSKPRHRPREAISGSIGPNHGRINDPKTTSHVRVVLSARDQHFRLGFPSRHRGDSQCWSHLGPQPGTHVNKLGDRDRLLPPESEPHGAQRPGSCRAVIDASALGAWLNATLLHPYRNPDHRCAMVRNLCNIVRNTYRVSTGTPSQVSSPFPPRGSWV